MKAKYFPLISLLLCLCLVLIGCTQPTPTPPSSEQTPPADIPAPPAEDTPEQGEPSTPDAPPAPAKKRVALTFDDGPHNIRTQEIVDELAKYDFHATFFVVGNRVDGTAYGGGRTLPYIVEHGNEIGIHGYTHEAYYDSCDDATYAYEIEQTVAAVHAVLPDYPLTLMRPIGGHISEQRAAASDFGVILWSTDSEDWRHKYSDASELSEAEKTERLETIIDNIMATLEDGSIILMHDIYQSTVDATRLLLQRLHEQGYEVVTVSELLGEVIPGTVYTARP